MKITAREIPPEPPTFKPIEITIKLETVSEVDNITNLINEMRRSGIGTFKYAFADTLEDALEFEDD